MKAIWRILASVVNGSGIDDPQNLPKALWSSWTWKGMSRVARKPTFWFPTWFDTDQTVQVQKMARGLKLWIEKEEGLYYQYVAKKRC